MQLMRFFSMASDGATTDLQISNGAFFGQFRASLRMHSVANYVSIWTLFSTSVTGSVLLCNALNISQIRL